MLNSIEVEIIGKLRKHVIACMPEESTAHDWPHVLRVVKNAMKISKHEGGNKFLIHLIALSHDLYDHKFFNRTDEEAKIALRKTLVNIGVDDEIIGKTIHNVFSLSFKGGKNLTTTLDWEGKIVQDADRIEAIGAIGIARAFAYGGFKKRMIAPTKNYAANTNSVELNETTFGHFFEKLLLLYDLLNTDTAKIMAKDRFEFMKEFVKRFEEEWGD